MLVGKILRSPHAHAIIKSIDISAAERLPGVKAVVTRDDFPEIKAGTPGGDMTRNAMAREKALYDGHPVAAVAATSESIAQAGAQADQGRLRGAAPRHRPGRGDEARRADPARARAHQGHQGRRPALQRDRAARPRHGRRREGLRRSRRDRRARIRHQADAPGLYRAAELRRDLDRGRPDRAVVLHPGAVGLSRPAHRNPQDRARPRSASPSRRWAAASAARPASTASRWRSCWRARPSAR